MATETSNIDDLLTGVQQASPEEVKNNEVVENEDDYGHEIEDNSNDTKALFENKETSETSEENKEIESLDEYGNKKEEENPVIRERLARQAKKYESEMAVLRAQLQAQQMPSAQQATDAGFEYNAESNQTWDQQLRAFVEQTVSGMTERQQKQAQALRDQQAQIEFESKFRDDVQRFPDFEDAITQVQAPITDAMVYATRGMKNPAAFLYAAAKRSPQELQRISKIQDPYVQIAEMGRLEASLRQTKPGTKAPKPIGRVLDDAGMPHKNDKEPSIEDLISKADAKRRAQIAARGSRR